MGLEVAVHDHGSDPLPNPDRWAEMAQTTLAAEGVNHGSFDLIFVDEDTIAELNHEHMGKPGPTDVLAFPMDGGDESIDGVPAHVGDVVICAAVAQRQAPDHAGSLEAELCLLIVHGVLHVLGHDHAEPDETAVMVERERYHLSRYSFVHPTQR